MTIACPENPHTMIFLGASGKRGDLLTQMLDLYPGFPALWSKIRGHVKQDNSKEVWEEQAAAIAYLASQYDYSGARILELGCNRGLTAGLMQLAAPSALVTTLEPSREMRRVARANIVPLGIVVRPEASVAYLELTKDSGVEYDLIFVDGDHKHIRDDLPWWNRLKVGGLFLHHDYSPLESARPCPPVYEALNDFAARLGRQPDVLVVDDTRVGIWGMYRREGEEWLG